MFDLEKAVAEWKKILRRNASVEDGDIAELERYLRDKVEDLIRQGSDSEAAFRQAEEEFRNSGALEAAYGHARSARPGGRFPWRPGRFSSQILRSHFKIAFRRLKHNKVHSLIKIGGLALGLTACLLAFLWIQDEVGYDRFQERADSIAQVYSLVDGGGGSRNVHMGSYYPLAAELKAKCPEVIEAARIALAQRAVIRFEDRIFNTDVIALADPAIFEIFTFSFLRGNAATALADRSAAVLTESMARKYFGDQDPVGRTLRVNGESDVHVTAVVKDIPSQSSLRFDAIVPFVLQFAPSFEEPTHWGGNPLETWVLLSAGADRAAVEGKVTAIVAPHFAQSPARVDFRLHPLLRKRLYSPEGNSLISMVLLFAGGALFVLALACVNFTNLSTAAAAARAKEVGIRKTTGARRPDIIRQFMGESWGTSFLALAAALVLLALTLPAFNRVAGKTLVFAAVLKPSTVLGFLAITVVAGFAAGVYPAFVLSSFPAQEALAGRRGGGPRHAAGLRKGLVVFQFALSLVLAAGTAVVGRQIAFIKAKDLGFDRQNLVVFRMGPALSQGYEGFRTELLRDPGIVGVTASFQNPVNVGSTVYGSAVDWAGKDPAMNITLNWDYVDYDYFETLKAAFVAGRPFSRDFPADIQGAYVINESAAALMDFADPVGQGLKIFRKEGTVVGVVRDFHFRPLRHSIRPIVYGLRPSSRSWAVVRVAPGSETASLRAIGETVKKLDPDTIFEPVFFDDLLVRSQYSVEQKIWTVANALTATSVFIACIGLFGLALHMTQQRTKEIGVRKVLGASAAGLAATLALNFLVWVALAVILASPLAYWVSQKILSPYAYRAPLGFGLFFLAGLAMIAIAGLTVGLHTLRAARANP
ncbi:MAG: FtsX-like permease family protein, partial [Candidatus Aminicenantes bacterium]|nr:FtsX-like permease family protein [Candidatus Aminicenantes bacterium]